MAFDWKTYVAWARTVQRPTAGTPSSEAVLRSALSRTYYGVFCYARNYARDWLNFKPRNDGDDHGRLRHHLKNRRRQGISDRLDRLRQRRNACDYLDDLVFDPDAVLKAALREADFIFAGLVPPNNP